MAGQSTDPNLAPTSGGVPSRGTGVPADHGRWQPLWAAVTLGCLLMSPPASVALAQTGTAVMIPRAAIVQALEVTPQRNLDFGNVVQGVPETIAVTDGGAGRFRIRGQASTPVLMTFTLPANLVSGANTLPIDSWTGRWNTSAAPGGGTSFTPSGAATSATLSGGVGQVFVSLGARVVPSGTQSAGLYAATVTLTVAYP